MNWDEFLAEVSYNLRGTDDDAPTVGTDDSAYWLNVFNRIKDELYSDSTKNWDSTWSTVSLGAVAASAAPTYALAATYTIETVDGWKFKRQSDHVYVIDTAGNKHTYKFIKPRERSLEQKVYMAGLKGKTLYFANPILSTDTIVAGTLYLPGYFIPPDITDEEDSVVLVDDPHWAAMAVAAEVAFNDLTYEDKAPDLQAKANNLYKLMIVNNRSGTYDESRKSRAPGGRNKIRSFR